MADLADRITAEAEINQHLVDKISGNRITDFSGKLNLVQLMECIRNARLLITSSTGPYIWRMPRILRYWDFSVRFLPIRQCVGGLPAKRMGGFTGLKEPGSLPYERLSLWWVSSTIVFQSDRGSIGAKTKELN